MGNQTEIWLSNLIKGLVSSPEHVQISRSTDEQGVLFIVKVADEDAGKIIGRMGNVSSCIRTLLRSVGYQENMRASMKIDAPMIQKSFD